MRRHRSENWVIVKGTARIMVGDKIYILRRGESIYVPVGVKHKVENIGKIPLEIIETQIGEYLEEDDIIRFPEEK